MNPHSLNAALRAAGAVVLGVDLVMAGHSHAAFCNIHPPGHHAECERRIMSTLEGGYALPALDTCFFPLEKFIHSISGKFNSAWYFLEYSHKD
jgi:acetoin utilization deacetylase AcuC-like enzyme